MRIGYLASGDGGHGFLNFASLFVMGGSTTGARFGGGTTGCDIPGNPGTPSSTVLDPLGNLWVGFKKGVQLFASPSRALLLKPALAHATSSSSPWLRSTRSQPVSPLSAMISGEPDGTSPFFIKNADTTCMVPPHGICTAPTDVINVLGAGPVGAAAVAVMSDQYYPATNGNNVYIALQEAPAVPPAPPNPPDNVAWLGNASAADATWQIQRLM